MIAGVIARRYAKALVDIGSETGTLDALVEEFGKVAAAYKESADFRNAMENPLVAYEAKQAVISDLAAQLQLSATTKNTLLMLNERRRLPALPGIAQLVREMSDVKKGLLRAEVTSAAPLSDAYYEKLKAHLEKLTGRKIAIDKKEDASLIAGVVTRIGDTVYDGSLRARLDELKTALLN